MVRREQNLPVIAWRLVVVVSLFPSTSFSWTAARFPQHTPRLTQNHALHSFLRIQSTKTYTSTSGYQSDMVTSSSERPMTTLAGDFLVSISSDNLEHEWALFPLNGAQEAEALLAPYPKEEKPVARLACVQTEADVLEVEVSYDTTGKIDKDLLHILQIVLLQMSAKRCSPTQKYWRISIGSSKDILDCDVSSEEGAEALFSSELGDLSTFEWVEMVTGSGEVLGKVPRPLVHKFNLLHRGIGMFVTKDRSLLDHSGNDFPPLYTHRRAASKRIFPSLYDMFVGGVSLADEPSELTARREVAEELGLSRALEDADALSGPILDCVVCTKLNRCFVTLFSYTMKTNEEEITWQDEEVAWGDFVPYPIIVAAADRSIRRFADKNEWPGTYPPIQSELKGREPKNISYEDGRWADWDFVPDGLLVWEAWLRR